LSRIENAADGDRSSRLYARVAIIYSVLLAVTVAAWAWAVVLFRGQPVFLGTALLAYGFGLRHAVDADHIAAIDNVTRKLMHDGKRPVSIGFWFAIGHSAVVILAAAVIALTASTMRTRFGSWMGAGEIISTSVSVVFLLAVAAMNLMILRSVWGRWARSAPAERTRG
jgi:nickel/cobalt transporter (NiCoT) family protein